MEAGAVARAPFDVFCDLVAEAYGNPRARFATDERIERGQAVRIMVNDPENFRVDDAKAIGKRERKMHVVWFTDANGRKWRLRLAPSDVLVEW